MQREILLFRSWYTPLLALNLNPNLNFKLRWHENYPAGTLELIPFSANLDIHWNRPAGTSGLLTFGYNLDHPWGWVFSDIPSWGFVFAFAGTS